MFGPAFAMASDAFFVILGHWLIVELIPRPTASGASRIPTLDYEAGDDAVKRRVGVVTIFCQTDEIVDRHGRILRVELSDDRPLVSLEGRRIGFRGSTRMAGAAAYCFGIPSAPSKR